MKKFVRLCFLFGMISSIFCLYAQPVSGYQLCSRKGIYGEPVTNSYTYSRWNGGNYVLSSPSPYIADYLVDSEALGLELSNPQDVTADKDGNFYITDTGNNRIICTDSQFNVQRVIDRFTVNGNVQTFQEPYGCYVTDDGQIYIADTDNSRIVVLDAKGNFLRIIDKPTSDILEDNFKFNPQKLAVDSAGRIYVVAKGVYEGIMVFYENGSFSGFIGSNPVHASVFDIIWRSFMTQTQKNKIEQYIPVEYSNLFLDSSSFIYCVSLSTEIENPIRRINLGGQDILIRKSLSDTPVSGDVPLDYSVSITGKSQFVDICADSNDIYYALDSKRGRIFSYDTDGNLLSVFGGLNSNQYGTFEKPAAVFMVGDSIGVLDSQSAAITVFRPTKYIQSIQKGLNSYKSGDYQQSIVDWKDVLKINGNFDLAYSKIGMALYRLEDYKEAMTYFQQGLDKTHYSKAFKEYRKAFMREHLGSIISGVVAAILFVAVFRYFIKKRHRLKVNH